MRFFQLARRDFRPIATDGDRRRIWRWGWHSKFTMLLTVSCVCGLNTRAPGQDEPESPAGIEFFEKKIRPVLVERCYKCHSNEAKEPKGGLLLDSGEGLRTGGDSGAAIVPGDPDASLLVKA